MCNVNIVFKERYFYIHLDDNGRRVVQKQSLWKNIYFHIEKLGVCPIFSLRESDYCEV